jgi:transposase
VSEYAGKQFVGVDLHRRRTVLVRTTDSGEVLESVRIPNDVDSLNRVLARAGVDPEVVLEATYGWYWAVDALQEAGARVHLAHPLGVKAFGGSSTTSGTPRTWPTCCGWAGCRRHG